MQILLVKDANGVVGGAKAELYASGKLVGEFVYDAADCAYTLDFTPQAGCDYRLNVLYNGVEVEATTVMQVAAERAFVCNPALEPKVFKESVFHDYEEYYLREGLYSLFEKYPSYTYNAQGADVVTYSYFVDKDGIVDKLYSTSMDRGLYNRSDESFVARYVMPGEPDKFADRVYREFLEGSVWKERKYDFSVYRQELKELYFDVIDKLEVKPPDKYDNPGLDYRW